jgi:hypothetical protein
MGASRPIPAQPLFQAPGQALPEPVTGKSGNSSEIELDDRGRCELPECDAPIPHCPGNEETARYCSHEHRREARAQRRRARFGGE